MRQFLIILGCTLFCGVSLLAQSPKRLFREADALFEEKVYNEALSIYLEGLKADPNNAEANFKAGLCHLETTYKEKAVPYLEKAFRGNPGMHPNLLMFLGEAYQYDHQFPKALQTYTPSARRRPPRTCWST
jgi:tetratricopeptide (TPR) repeat protein